VRAIDREKTFSYLRVFTRPSPLTPLPKGEGTDFRESTMNTLIDKNTRVLIQGITGKQGRRVSMEMLDYGTHVVAGVTPGRGGQDVYGVPVYNSVAEAMAEHTDINASLVSVPREGTKDAVLEAIAVGKIKMVNILTEGVPRQDAARIVRAARDAGVRVVGPASVGIINPIDRVKIGAIGGNDPGVFYPGEIAIFSKSGGMCLSLATEIFNVLGHGTSIVVGIGGDRISGSDFCDLLELVRNDDRTKLVILNGEVGGDYEERAARYIQDTRFPKPVIARITGIGAQNIFPRGSRMGHAGAIIGEGRFGTYESKVEAFERVGVPVAKTSEDLVGFIEKTLPHRRQDFEAPLSKDFELVSISKQKLETMKSQLRAVQIRTHLTQIVDGTPFFRGRALPQLMRQASAARMIFEALTKEDDGRQQTDQLARDLVLCATTNPASESARAAARASSRGGSPMNAAIAAGLLALPAAGNPLPAALHQRYAPLEADALTLFTQVVDLVACILGNELQWNESEHLESAMFRAIAGRQPSRVENLLMQAIFVSCVDHTPATPSSLAAIASYSGGTSLKTALAAGISAMGESHAGAGEGTGQILQTYLAKLRESGGAFEADGVRVADLKDLAAYIINKITGAYGGQKGKIPGYGHRHYGLYGRDPRAVALLTIAKELGLAGDHCTLACEIETILKKKKAMGLCFNVDGVIGALLSDLGLRPETGKAFFIIPRTVGLLGQLLEQDPGSFFRLANESVIYIGPGPRA
jgi:succinyl-CoA synthetase alpha subunit